MHIEVQVALNFVISYLYNKLPRRRVNIFGEELERALKDKFRGHWYPEKPFRGSAFRCLKTGDPIDPVLERAARESGVPVQDILENLPHELAVWVDPGEVSYRIGEKGAVKILFSDKHDLSDDHLADREVTKTFNPEAQCFRPIEALQSLQSLQPLHHAPHPHHVAPVPGLVLPPPGPTLGPSMAPSMGQAMGQGMNQAMGQGMNQAMSQGMNQAMSQGMNQAMSQGMNQAMSQGMNQAMSQGMNQAMSQGMNQAMSQGMNQAMSQGMNQAMSQSMVQSMVQSMGQAMGPGMGQSMGSSMGPSGSQPASPFEQSGMGAIGQPAGIANGSAASNGVLVAAPSSAPSPIPYKGSPSPVTPFLPRSSAPLTFTTATFAQTKFGSTKLKTNSKRANRMSPTEFSNYIKQRAMQQQQQQQQMHHHGVGPVGHHHLPPSQLSPQGGSVGPGRSLSPSVLTDPASFFFPGAQYQQQHFGPTGPSGASGPGLSPRGVYDSGSSPFLDMYSSPKSYTSFLDHHTSYYNGSSFGSGAPTPGPISSGMPSASPSGGSAGSGGSGSHSPGVIGSSSSSSALGGGGLGLGGVGSTVGNQSQAEKQLLEGFSNFSLGPHPSNSQYQHLLVAN